MQGLNSLIVSDEASFQSLFDDWNDLAHRTDKNSVFFRHEWHDASWQWLRDDGCELCVVCIRRDGVLIGLCPLVCRRIKRAGMQLRQLTALAVPDNQEFSLLADPVDVEDVAACLMDVLKSGAVRWDIMSLERLPTDLPATKILQRKASGSGYGVHALQKHDNPGISLRDDWDAYYGRRSRRLKKGNNLVRNRLQRDGKVVEIKCFDSRSEGFELQALIKTLTEISASSWKAGTGLTLDNPGPGTFLARLSELAMENSWFLVWLLTIDEEPAAMEYQLEFNGVISGLRADYDGRFHDYSPGTLLNWKIIERLFERGASYYALGPGSNPYKARWVEDARELVDIVIFGSSIRARGLRIVELHLKPFIKRILRKVGGKRLEGSS